MLGIGASFSQGCWLAHCEDVNDEKEEAARNGERSHSTALRSPGRAGYSSTGRLTSLLSHC